MSWQDLKREYEGIPTDAQLDADIASLRTTAASYDAQTNFGLIFTVNVADQPSREAFKAFEERIRARLQAVSAKDKRFGINNFVVTTAYSALGQLTLVGM